MTLGDFLNKVLDRLASDGPSKAVAVPALPLAYFTVEHGNDVYQLDARPALRRHAVSTIESLGAYAHREQERRTWTADEATIFVGKSVSLVLGDCREAAAFEVVSCHLDMHHRLDRWMKLVTKGMPHKELRTACEQYKDDIVDKGLLASLVRVSVRHSIEVDSDDADGVLIKILDGQKAAGTATIPKSFRVRVPVFKAMPDHLYELEMALGVRLEKGDAPKAVFDLTVLNLDDVLEAARAEVFEATRAVMGDGWLVVQGDAQASDAPPIRIAKK